MEPFHIYINEYRKQLKKGDIQKAYRGLMEYIMDLRTYLKNKYPDYNVSGRTDIDYLSVKRSEESIVIS